MPYDAMESERLQFLYELYTRSAGDARQGVPYEVLIAALGFGEAVTKRLQCELQQEGWVELSTVPPMTYMSRRTADCSHRKSRQLTIAMTSQGLRLMEDILATRHAAPAHASASPGENTTVPCVHATDARAPQWCPPTLFYLEWKKLARHAVSTHVATQVVWDLLAWDFEDVRRCTPVPALAAHIIGRAEPG
jgi:hypothetical protein